MSMNRFAFVLLTVAFTTTAVSCDIGETLVFKPTRLEAKNFLIFIKFGSEF